MNEVEVESDWLDTQSGQFTAAARQAAISEALPLLASYFVSGADSLNYSQALSRETDDDYGDLLEFVQIRVLLAAADRLGPMVRGILLRPSFQYRRVREDSVGVVRGRLEMISYLRRRHEVQAPRRFPVSNVLRSYRLPENVLATWAVLSVAKMLKQLPFHRLPPEAPERRRAERSAEALRHLAQQPALSECVEAAEIVWRKGTHLAILDRVQARLRSGHVPNVEWYEALADWVQRFDTKNIALDSGDVEWLFYEQSFDTKLFELWCLNRLIQALTVRLGEPRTRRLLVDRGRHPVVEWAIGSVLIEVWFQAGLGTIDVGAQRWAYDPRPATGDRPADESKPTGNFGGIPDIAVVVTDAAKRRRAVILDPKLRQRKGIPGAEVYKIIGYLANLPEDHPPRGGVIFHGPGCQRSYRISNKNEGEILALAVDPLDQQGSDVRFRDLADFVIASVSKSTLTRAAGPADADDPSAVEEWVEGVQQQSVTEMAYSMTEDCFQRARKSLRASLLDVWECLDNDTQRMLATAEWFGSEATSEMDHSGPLLGLTAGCERVLRVYLDSLGVAVPPKLTFGQMLRFFEDACLDRYDGRALRAALLDRGVDLKALRQLVSRLFKLNHRYRIPAAHADVLEEFEYHEGRAALLLGRDAALARMVKILGLEPAEN
ncbi:hypothetical protein AU189_17755 [Mycolicibacterium acapulense]|nr:hypothetical protein AU189_17755 [Mycolicibacterium acapulense]